MSSMRENEDEVRRRKERLLAEYDDVEVEERREEFPTGRFGELRAGSEEGYVGGGYIWVVRPEVDAPELSPTMPDGAGEDGDRALMIVPRGTHESTHRWGLPGGGLEDGETYEEAAVREVDEETNITSTITDCWLVRHTIAEHETNPDKQLHTLYAFFDGTYVSGQIAIQGGELNGAAWFAEPPAEMRPANQHRAVDYWDEYEPPSE